MNEIYAETIRQNLKNQDDIKSKLENDMKACNEKIMSLQNQIEVVNLIREVLKSKLESISPKHLNSGYQVTATVEQSPISFLGVSSISKVSDQENVALSADPRVDLSPDYLLHLIEISKNPMGPQANELVKKFSEFGIKTHNKQILNMLSNLESEGRIYQTNPENIRGKRYKLK